MTVFRGVFLAVKGEGRSSGKVVLNFKKERHKEMTLFAVERLPKDSENFKIRLGFVYLG